MTLTEKQLEMFKSLKNSGLGKQLTEYLGTLLDELCDIRNMPTASDEERKARLHLVTLIQTELIDRLSTQTPNHSGPNSFE